MRRVDGDLPESRNYGGARRTWGQRRADHEVPRERRVGPSRLSTWSARQLAVIIVGWIASVLALVVIAAGINIFSEHSTDDVRLALTRSNLIGLIGTLVAPPACLMWEWWRMRGRRRDRST